MNAIITSQPTIELTFETLTARITDNLAPASRRVYLHTFREWTRFAAARGIGDLDLTFDAVNEFVNAANVGKSTRQNRLSHIRKVLEILAIANPDFAPHYALVKAVVKVKARTDDADRKSNSKRALSRAELLQFLSVWSDDDSPLGVRNNAMVRLDVYTGLRRSELVALRWDDIDLDSQTITIRHGKGDKERVAAIADVTIGTARALTKLRAAQGQAYNFVFPRMTRGKGSRFGDDKPANPQTAYAVVTRTAHLADIGHLSPHDLRRTHITTALDAGATLADMQAQAGHARGETTLRYAQASEAKARRQRILF